MSASAGLDKPSDAAARSSLVRDASGFMAATYISQMLAFGIGVVTKGMLGPEDLGIWTLLLAVLSFLGLLEFGVIQAANKEIAYALSKGDEQAAERYKRVQFSFVALTSVLGATALALYALWFPSDRHALSIGLIAIALMLPISQLQLGQVSVYWANRHFAATSLLIIIETVLGGTVGLFLVWQFGLAGQVTSFFLILLVKVGSLAWQAGGHTPLRVGFSWDADTIRHLLKIGIPLLLINLSNVLKLSGTVFLISHYFDTQSVGFYSLALSVQNFIYWTPNAFSVVMFPRFQSRYADSNDQAGALRSFLVKPILGLAFFLLPLLLSAAYFIVPTLIEHALPAYVPSIAVLAVMLPGTFFLSLEHMPAQFLTTTNRLWERVVISLSSLALLGLCVLPAMVLEANLLIFVASLSVASLLAFLIAFTYAIHVAKGPRSDRRLPFVVVAAAVYVAIVVLTIDQWGPTSHGPWWADVLVAGGKWGLSLVLFAPLFYMAERQLQLASTLAHLVRNLRRRTT